MFRNLAYIRRACLFHTQQEWFDAADKRKAICRELFERHLDLVHIIFHQQLIAGQLCQPSKLSCSSGWH